MQSTLREIFDGIYEEKIAAHPMTKAESAVWENAQSLLGEDFVDKMVCSQSRSLTEGQFDSFRQGFRLGALLMLELI